MLRIAWLLNGVFLAAILLRAETAAVDVCTAAKMANSGKERSIVIRGSGQVLEDGLMLASTACPIAKTSYDELPTIVVVQVASFASAAEESRFARTRPEKGLLSPLLDVEVSGTLACRAHMHYIRNGGEIVGADGFGWHGLYKCALRSAELRHIVNSAVQPDHGKWLPK